MKNYILILLAVFGVSLAATPVISASKAPEIDFDRAAEVENIPEIATISEIKITDIAEDAQITIPVQTAPRATSNTTSVSNNFNYTVTQKTGSIVASPSNTDIYKTGKLVYAHNDPALMLSALSLRAGSIFTVTENGVTKTYRVAETQIISKAELAAVIPGTSYNLMSKVAYSAENQNGVKHSIALMTCYERTRGAANRYVVFANEI